MTFLHTISISLAWHLHHQKWPPHSALVKHSQQSKWKMSGLKLLSTEKKRKHSLRIPPCIKTIWWDWWHKRYTLSLPLSPETICKKWQQDASKLPYTYSIRLTALLQFQKGRYSWFSFGAYSWLYSVWKSNNVIVNFAMLLTIGLSLRYKRKGPLKLKEVNLKTSYSCSHSETRLSCCDSF